MTSFFKWLIRAAGVISVLLAALAGPAASRAATVILTNSDASGSSSFNSAGNWSNGQAPSSTNDYVVAVQYLRTPQDANSYTFQGNSLTITNGGGMIYKGTAAVNTYTITNFVLYNGGLIRSGAGSGNTMILAGTLTINGANASSEIRADQSPYSINSTLAGTGNLLFSTAGTGYMTTLNGSNSYTGNITVSGLLTLWGGANLNFVVGGSGTNNSISGSGTTTFNGIFDFDLSGASTNLGDHWTIVNSASLTASYGNSFSVQGFVLQGGWTGGPGFWDLNTNGVYYEYSTTSGVLSVVSQPSTNGPGSWETLLDGTEFSSSNTFIQYWNYNYPWGNTHNGSAVMSPTNISFAGNVMTIQSIPRSSADTNYYSGTCWSQWQLQVSSTFPSWQVSGTFQVASQTGCWPAMWFDGSSSWPPESDVMEFYSSVCHQNTYDGVWQSQTTSVSSPGSWHTYSATFTLTNSTWENIKYYIDGVLRSTQTAHSNFVGKSMWLIIDYQMNGSSGSPGPNYTTYLVCTNVTLSRQSMLTAAPATPTNVTAAVVNGSAAISWSGTSGTTYYKVKRSLTSGGPYTNIASRLMSTRYVDTGLANGTNYYYVVTARNAIDESAGSTETSGAPQVPIDLNAPTTNSSYQTGNDPSHGNDGDLSTRWTASDSTYPQWWRVDLGSTQTITKAIINWYNPSSRSYQYKIETSSDDVNYSLLVDQTGRTAIGDSTDTFSASARYVRVTVTGVNVSGGYAAFYECQLFSPPAAPTGLTATAGNAQVNLTWTASAGATNYIVKRATVSGGSYTTIGSSTGTSYTDSNVVNGTTYYYVVSAVNAGGDGPNSSEVSTYVLSLFEQWQMNYFSCTNCPQADPNADPLGKRMSNTNAFLAGFSPADAEAYPRIISIAVSNGTDIAISYLGSNGDTNYAGGPASRTNVLEFTTGAADGGYTNNFASTGLTNVLSGGTGLGTNVNVTESFGATNRPARYYRVRVLVP